MLIQTHKLQRCTPQGLPTPPEQSLLFSVPLGSRETRTYRFRHMLDEKTDYRVSLASSSGGGGGGRDTGSSGSNPQAAGEEDALLSVVV